MIFEWLEDMVDDGLITEKTAEAIYQDCDKIIKEANVAQTAAGLTDEAAELAAKRQQLFQQAAEGVKQMLSAGILGATAFTAGNFISGIRKQRVADNMAKTIVDNKAAIGMTFAQNKDKAEQRFAEMASVAPSLAADLGLAQKILKDKVNSGFTSTDFQNLAVAQSQFSADNPALKPAVEDAMSMKITKEGSAQEGVSPYKWGEITADCYQMVSEAGIFKEAASMFPNKADLLKYVIGVSAATSMPALISAATGAVKHMHGKKMQAQMEKDLKTSFNEAYKRSKDTDPMKMHGRAESEKAFKTLTHFAPNVAVDPEAARGYLNRVLEMDRGLMSSDLKDLTQIESNIRNATGPSDFATGFGAASKALGMAPIAQEAAKQSLGLGKQPPAPAPAAAAVTGG